MKISNSHLDSESKKLRELNIKLQNKEQQVNNIFGVHAHATIYACLYKYIIEYYCKTFVLHVNTIINH